MKNLFHLLLILFLTGCLGPVQDLYPDDESLRPVPLYIISHGWHTGIAMEKDLIWKQLPPGDRLPDGNYLMFEWGDARYFPHEDPGFGLLLRAALLPTSSVIHVTGLFSRPGQAFPNSRVVQIKVTKEGLHELGEFISDQFRKDKEKHIIFADEGLYRNSIFFEADRLYFFPRTSNIWTARALRKTGYPITPFWALTSGNIIKQSKKDGNELP